MLLRAQTMHSDIRFDYDANQIDLQVNDVSGGRVYVGEFAVDGFFRQFETNPGFASEGDAGLGIKPGDTIVFHVLDRLLFWNGSSFADPGALTQIRIDNNGAAPDTLVTSSSGPLPGGFDPPSNLIDQADSSGEFHSHVEFLLEPNIAPNPPPLPEIGVYGLKLSLSTDAPGISDSDPFLAVFNFGLDSTGFEHAVERFAKLLAPDLLSDYDRNGAVNREDLLLWQQEFGLPPITSGSGADGNSDGIVDGLDFFLWQRQLGATVSAVTAHSMFAVPEPSTAAFVATAICGVLAVGHRRRRCHSSSRSSCPLQNRGDDMV